MSNITIITIDEQGRIVKPDQTLQITIPIVGEVIGERIYIRPDWLPLGDPDFAEKLRAWHATHNAPRCNWDQVESADFDGCNGCPRTCATE